MKLNYLLILFLIPAILSCKKDCPEPSSNTITFQHGPNDGNDAYVIALASDPAWANGNTNSNPNTFRELSASAWTNGGALVVTRSFFSFKLTDIPADAEITSAKLSLYGVATSNVSPQGNSGDNRILLQRVLDNWNESTITWNTQPMITTEGQIELPPTTSDFNFSYTDINVTQLVKAMKLLSPEKTAGFCIRLKDEAVYRSLALASSDHEDASKRPKLEIQYRH